MPLLLVRNDVTKVKADAIMNMADTELWQGRGTSRAIYLAAGEEKLEEDQSLYSVYRESLELAKEYELESIAFPLDSPEDCDYSKERALKTVVSAIRDFLEENDMLVYLVLNDRKSVSLSQEMLHSIEEYIDAHYTEVDREDDESYSLDSESDRLLPKSRGRKRSLRRKQIRIGRPPSASAWHSPISPQPASARHAPSAQAQEERESPDEKGKRRKLEDIMKHMGETFSQMLLRLIDEKGYTDAQVYRRANIDRRHFSKIRNNVDYVPNKKTVMAFAIALELTLDEAKDLLRSAGFAFSDGSKFDVIVSFFLESRIYDVFAINEVLFVYGQPLIGE